MMSRLHPTQAANSVLDLDLPQLFSLGKRVLIFDLDQTLCRRGTKTLDPEVAQYINDVKEAGPPQNRSRDHGSWKTKAKRLCPDAGAARFDASQDRHGW